MTVGRVRQLGDDRTPGGTRGDRLRVVIVGAGIGGLAAALRLTSAGCDVTVLEAADAPGGKIRTRPSAAGPVDAGPTVLTMRPVFEALFAACGERLSDHVTLSPLPVIARHFWQDGTRFDLMADRGATLDNVRAAFGARSAREFEAFAGRAARLYDTFDAPMMQAADPSTLSLAGAIARAPGRLGDMAPGRSLAAMLDGAFSDPRLGQLFGRYATYVGGSPYGAPALLSLISEAEARGVWAVEGGMAGLARAIADLAAAKGARLVCGTEATSLRVEDGRTTGVETSAGPVEADAVIFNGDPRALEQGLMGEAARRAVNRAAVAPRSLSAWVQAFAARATGPELAYHTVFFGTDPRAEFGPLARGRTPSDATLYVCAQDRAGPTSPPGPNDSRSF